MKHNVGKMPEITRNTYNTVRKYDRRQFEAFCRSLYETGRADGSIGAEAIEAVKQAHDAGYAAGIKDTVEAMARVKGIGPKKIEEVRAAIRQETAEK